MWTPEEQRLFDTCTSLIGAADYEQGLAVASQLNERIKRDPAKNAYVLGCKIAVALRGLGQEAEAERAFQTASNIAFGAGEPVIAAYVLNDWSLMLKPDAAITMVRKALALCGGVVGSPDPARTIPADIAYFTAMLARHSLRAKHSAQIAVMLTRARQSLKRYARTHPRYRSAYVVALMWERELGRHQPGRNWRWKLSIDWLIALEVIRQRKYVVAAKLLRKGRLKHLQTRVRP